MSTSQQETARHRRRQMARTPPSSSSSPPVGNALPPAAPIVSTSWSHIETVNLIESYREKWYALNRGQLRAHQWEEVAQLVAGRCGFDPPSKTATQCRHKIEKLRKRYRVEKQRGPASAAAWPYFRIMDLMESGSAANDARSRSRPPPVSSSSDEDRDEDDEAGNNINNNTRSISHILRRPLLIDNSFPRFSRNPRFRKRSFTEEERGEAEKPFDETMSELAAVIRSVGEGFVRTEKMKMEMMSEIERNRMEMERKRTELLLDSQMRIADAIKTAILLHKKVKTEEDMMI